MEYLIAVASQDGIGIRQHFGQAEAFRIYKVEDNEGYRFTENRPAPAPGQSEGHDGARLTRIAEVLSDCRYVLSAKIGPGAQAVLQAAGITPLETTHPIEYALDKVMLYDKKYKHERRL